MLTNFCRLYNVKLTVSELELNAADERKFGDDIDIPRHGNFCPTSDTRTDNKNIYNILFSDRMQTLYISHLLLNTAMALAHGLVVFCL